jgi:GR25 family glycosyltransferase involved in LPS biosynthesis
MKAFVIRIKGDESSESAAKHLVKSCHDKFIEFRMFDAITPDLVDIVMNQLNIKWNYPWSGMQMDFTTGLRKTAYPTVDPKKRIGCFLSHYKLWQTCVAYDEPIIIHEHDALYFHEANRLPIKDWKNSHFDIIGFNSPLGATRLQHKYHQVVQDSSANHGVVRAPQIDDLQVPQGIAGNSSYFIKPAGAKKLIDLVAEYGAWPNDAIMCRQLITTLGQSQKYYTHLQKIQSTTSL